MKKILKHSIIAGSVIASIGAAPVAAQVAQPRPVLKPVGPLRPAPVAETTPMSQADITARIKPGPRALDRSQLNMRASSLPGIGGQPVTWQEEFRMGPIGPYGEQGSLMIEGDVVETSPGVGQAIISYKSAGWGKTYGGVFLTINAKAGVRYLVSCQAAIEFGQREVNYAISGASAPATGIAQIIGGHVVFDFRGMGEAVALKFNPHAGKMAMVNGKMVVPNVMDFWGCSIFNGV